MDSVRKIDPEIRLKGILIVGVGCCTCGEKKHFSASEIGNVLTCAATISSDTANRSQQMDSARQTGLEIRLKGILIVDVDCCIDDEEVEVLNFQLRKSGMVCLVQSQSAVLQQIGADRWIQLLKQV